MFAECRMQSAECRVQSAECREQSAECRVQSAECSVLSAECRVQSAECRVQCRVSAAQCRVHTAPPGSIRLLARIVCRQPAAWYNQQPRLVASACLPGLPVVILPPGNAASGSICKACKAKTAQQGFHSKACIETCGFETVPKNFRSS